MFYPVKIFTHNKNNNNNNNNNNNKVKKSAVSVVSAPLRDFLVLKHLLKTVHILNGSNGLNMADF